MMIFPEKFDSHQNMIKQTFELQYKKDDALKKVEQHHHDFYEIYFLISGDVTYIVNDRSYHILPGDLLLIAPNEPHQVCIENQIDSYERYVLWLESGIVHQLSTKETDLESGLCSLLAKEQRQLRLAPEKQKIIKQLLELIYYEGNTNTYGAKLMCSSCLVQLLVNINRLMMQENNYMEKARASPIVFQAVAYIQNHYFEPLSLESLADQLYVSKYHLSHEFHRLMGMSVCRYIQKRRLMMAQQLLRQGKKAKNVCFDCGFNDYAGFYRAFKAEYGSSPREYAKGLQTETIKAVETA